MKCRVSGFEAVRFAASLSLFLLISGAHGSAFANPTFVNADAPDLPSVARGVPMGGALRVLDLQLQHGGAVDLELTRFEVFAPGATFTVMNGPKVSAPDVAYFRGRTSDDSNAVVMLAVPARGKAHGVVANSTGSWMLQFEGKQKGIRTRMVDPATDFAGRSFECESDGLRLTGATVASAAPSGAAAAAGLPGSGTPLAVKYTGHVIVDTDVEYWEEFWNLPGNTGNPTKTANAALAYLGDLFAYASTAYEREVDTNLEISYARLWAGAEDTDPYSANTNACGCTGSGKLQEVQSVWSGNSTPRTIVHFVSGKSEGCGCANIGVLCSQANGYGASSSIGTGFNIDSPGFMWEGIVIAHEIGHNFNSQHTHNYCGEAGISDPVDVCVDKATDNVDNCLGNNNRSLPGLGSLTGGTPGAQDGTIMSYCHQETGGYANIAHTFGLYHPYGRAAYRVPNKMLAHVQSSTACMALDYTGSDLRVVKDCKPDDPMLVGQTATCTITVENLGPNIAQGALTVDKLLSNGTFTIGTVTVTKDGTAQPADTCTTTANPQNGSGTVTCNLDLLDVGHKAVIVVPISGSTPQNINDRVTVSSDSPDPDQTNNVAEDEVNIVEPTTDLAITKLCKPDSGPYYAGQGVPPYCVIEVTNLGPDAATGVALVDKIVASGPFKVTTVNTDVGYNDSCTPSPGLNTATTTSTVSCTLTDPLPSGAKWTISVVYSATEPTDINDEATVTADTSDPDSANNVATGSIVVAGAADLSITKDDDFDPIVAGKPLTYTITVTNNGPSIAKDVKVTDAVPAGVTIQSVTPSVGACVQGEAGNAAKPTVCSFGDLAPSASATVTIVVNVNPDTRGVLLNSATVSSSTFDPNGANNTAQQSTTVDAVSALEVVKTDSPDPVLAGAELFYTITVTNDGPSTASDVQLRDTLPAGVTYESGVNGNGQTVCALSPGNLVICNLGALAPAQSYQVFITVKVDPSLPADTVLTNNVTVTTPEDADGATDSEDTTVQTQADVWIDKSQNYPTGNPAGAVIYYLTAYNRPDCEADDQLTCWPNSGGPSDAQDVVITDPLPWTPKILIVQYVSPGCVYDKGTHTVTCTAGTVAVGQSASFRIEAQIKGSKGTRDNTATVSTSTPDPVPDNDSDTVATTSQGGTGKGGRGGK